MKTMKSPLTTLLFSGMFVVLAGCGDQANRQPAEAEEATEMQETVNPPKGIITLDEARQDYELYGKRRVPLIQRYEDSILRRDHKDSTFIVARYVAFDFKQMQDYMKWIEQEAAAVGADITSLRIYFSNNPDADGYVHPKQNSVMLVPAATPDAETGDQYILYLNNGKPGYLDENLRPWSPNGMGVLQGEVQRTEASLLPDPAALLSLQTGSMFMNEGSSSPPPSK